MPGFPLVLAADVGGTKTLLCLAEVGPGLTFSVLHQARYDSAAWHSLTPMLDSFLRGQPRPQCACIAVAAPVNQRRLRLTNLSLWVDADEIEAVCGIARVILVNDFVAVGYGIEALEPPDVLTLQEGQPLAQAPRAVLGAGTGLGEAILVWQGDHYEVLPSEGGHVDFAPTDEEQVGLWRFLHQRHGHVSYECILSGPGLVALYEYVCQTMGVAVALREPEAISRAALHGGDEAADRALELFCRIYGAQAGNLALTAWANGGVYVAGGMAVHLSARLAAGGFMQAFCAKGRYREALGHFPVHVVLQPDVGLKGALRLAARSLSRPSST